MLNVNGPTSIAALSGVKILALTAQPIATAKRVGISIHLLNNVVSPKARNIKIINNAKLIGELVYTHLLKIKQYFIQREQIPPLLEGFLLLDYHITFYDWQIH